MPEPASKNRRRLIALTVMMALLFGLPVLATAFNKLIQPQRHAEAAYCLRVEAGGPASNGCDFTIIAAVCERRDAQDRNDDPCTLQSLEPGEPLSDGPAPPSAGARYTMACKAPFIPKWGPSLSNASILQKRCGRPERAKRASEAG